MKAGENLLNQNDALMRERDETRRWILEIGTLLNVISIGTGESVKEEWAIFRNDILEAIKAL